MEELFDKNPPIIFVVGTTASGKSRLSLNLAPRLNGSVCNMDSIQVFERLDIGSAKPSAEEQSLCPHYMFDFVPPMEEFTAGDYRRESLKVIERVSSTQPLFFVGGSGFYMQALEKGMFDVGKSTPEFKKEIQDEIESIGYEAAYTELECLDPEYSKKISANDHYRLLRAFEIMRLEGKTVTQAHKDFEAQRSDLSDKHKLIKVGLYLERDHLRKIVKIRAEKMIAAGFIDEVRTLVEEGYKQWTPMSSVGYKEVIAYLDGQLTADSLLDEIVKSTMRLAKKQSTWFKRDKQVSWFHSINELEKAQNYVLQQVGEV